MTATASTVKSTSATTTEATAASAVEASATSYCTGVYATITAA